MISGGRLPSDGRLPAERDLAAELELGRRAVRRALEALEVEGLVWRRQGKGTFAGQPPDPAGLLAARQAGEADPMAVMEARLCLEPGLAALAARRAGPEDVARLRGLARRTSLAADAPQAELWDGALHRLLARIAGNPILLTTFSFLDEVRLGADWQARRHRARTPETQALYDRQHGAIVDAVARAEPDAAERAMREHLMALRNALRDAEDDA
jgi:DNA-binding FadR family transcriptional regulator